MPPSSTFGVKMTPWLHPVHGCNSSIMIVKEAKMYWTVSI